MKPKLGLLTMLLILGLLCGQASAALTTIGTATYMGSDYNLIWDDDNNGNSVVWLDYTNAQADWSTQTAWAADLDATLTYNIHAQYSVTWDGDWRLPSTVDGPSGFGNDGTTTAGFNITTSEMGHLYYDELGNLGYYDTSGNTQSVHGLQETGDFDNLIASWYWSSTASAEMPNRAWRFYMGNGVQDNYLQSSNYYGLAVRSGDVSAVPIPGAVWLLGSGLIGLAGFRRKFKK